MAAVGLAVIFVDELQRGLQRHRVARWTIAVLLVLAGIGAFLADKRQHEEDQHHLTSEITRTAVETAQRITAELAPKITADTAGQVTDRLNKDYGKVISGLYGEILALREHEVRLAFEPALDLIYAGDRLQVWNRGKTNLYLWGTRYNEAPRDMSTVPVVISSGSYYYLLTEKLRRGILETLGQNGEARVPLDLYISTEDKKTYIAHCELWEIVKDGEFTIHTQLHGFERDRW
jgi:hypothetical protein